MMGITSFPKIGLIIYAPLWAIQILEDSMALLPFILAMPTVFYWISYIGAAYQLLRLVNGKYDSYKDYARNVLILTLIGVVLLVPWNLYPSAHAGGRDYYTLYLPTPFASILALIIGHLLKREIVSEPWHEGEQ
jgi:hypothetical protein